MTQMMADYDAAQGLTQRPESSLAEAAQSSVTDTLQDLGDSEGEAVVVDSPPGVGKQIDGCMERGALEFAAGVREASSPVPGLSLVDHHPCLVHDVSRASSGLNDFHQSSQVHHNEFELRHILPPVPPEVPEFPVPGPSGVQSSNAAIPGGREWPLSSSPLPPSHHLPLSNQCDPPLPSPLAQVSLSEVLSTSSSSDQLNPAQCLYQMGLERRALDFIRFCKVNGVGCPCGIEPIRENLLTLAHVADWLLQVHGVGENQTDQGHQGTGVIDDPIVISDVSGEAEFSDDGMEG